MPEKKQCPHCDKQYINLPQHITKIHDKIKLTIQLDDEGWIEDVYIKGKYKGHRISDEYALDERQNDNEVRIIFDIDEMKLGGRVSRYNTGWFLTITLDKDNNYKVIKVEESKPVAFEMNKLIDVYKHNISITVRKDN